MHYYLKCGGGIYDDMSALEYLVPHVWIDNSHLGSDNNCNSCSNFCLFLVIGLVESKLGRYSILRRKIATMRNFVFI